MKILARYQFREVLFPLVVWVGFLFLLLFVMSFLRGADVLLGSAVTLRDFAKFVLFLAPNFMQQAIPIAFLLAILLGLGRLSEDGETTAMRSLGVGPWQLLKGPLIMGGLLGIMIWLLAQYFTPLGLQNVKETLNDIIKRNLAGDVKSGVFYDDLSDVTLYAEKVLSAQKGWKNVMVYDGRDEESPLLVLAREGHVRSIKQGEDLKLILNQGVLHRPSLETNEYTQLHFEKAELLLGVGEAFRQKNRFRAPKEEMTFGQLRQAAMDAQRSGQNVKPFELALHARWGLAFLPVAFAFLGTPLALTRRKSGKARGFVLTLLGYILHYVLSRVFATMSERGDVPLWLGAQMANVIFTGLGLWVLWRLSRVRSSA